MNVRPGRALSATGLVGPARVVDSGDVLSTSGLGELYAHPVVAFVVDVDDLHDEPDRERVLLATRAVYGAIELVDGSGTTSHLVLGGRRVAPGSVDLAVMGCLFERDGRLVATAAGAAVGHPASDVAAVLSRAMDDSGTGLEAVLVVTRALSSSVEVGDARSLAAVFSVLGRVGCALRR